MTSIRVLRADNGETIRMKPKIARRIRSVSVDTFKQLLQSKQIRGASLYDVEGLHHSRSLYVHPNIKPVCFYVEV